MSEHRHGCPKHPASGLTWIEQSAAVCTCQAATPRYPICPRCRYAGDMCKCPPAVVSAIADTGIQDDGAELAYERLHARLLDTAGLDAIPDPEPLIGGVLQLDSLAWLAGPPGAAKTFLALDMAGSVATGQTWQGYRVTARTVLYVIAEGARGIRPRVRAWETAAGQPMTGATFLPVAVPASKDPHWSALCRIAHELATGLVVLDTQARTALGWDENSARDMGEFVEKLEHLRAASGACVLALHHTPRNGTNLRGSTALEGAATTIMRVAKDDDLVTVTCAKQKDAADFDEINLRLIPTGNAAILSPTEGRPAVHSGTPAVRRMLDAWWNSHETDWVSVTTLVDGGACAKTTFHRAAKTLVRAHIVEEKGDGSGRRYRLLQNPGAL